MGLDEGQGTAAWLHYSGLQRYLYLFVLFMISTMSFTDRMVISVLLEPIKTEFHVSDTALGLLSGFSFALFYATLGIPVARYADRGNRVRLIAGALTVWSAATALCGVAQSFGLLALARIGVGVGESGAIPPAQSLIVDYFPQDQRTRAFALFLTSGTAGYLLGFVGGAQIAAAYGWRMAFVAMGLPGLALALISLFVLPEPRNHPGRMPPPADRGGVMQTVRALLGKPSFVNLLLALAFYFFVAYGAVIFFPSYMVRVLGIPLQRAGALYGGVAAFAAIIGSIGGGLLLDRLARRDRRWLAWAPAIAALAVFPVYELAMGLGTLRAMLIGTFIGGVILSAILPAPFAVLQMICGSGRRASSVAIVLFCSNLIGIGLGPMVTGALSDSLTGAWGVTGLRYALMLAMLAFVPAAFFFARVARWMEKDEES